MCDWLQNALVHRDNGHTSFPCKIALSIGSDKLWESEIEEMHTQGLQAQVTFFNIVHCLHPIVVDESQKGHSLDLQEEKQSQGTCGNVAFRKESHLARN